MTNIIGGNAGKIQHFDQGPDGLTTNGTNKGQSADFFQLISLLSDSKIGSEKSSDVNKIISPDDTEHLSPDKMINMIEDFKASLVLSDDDNIDSSTLSQLRGIIKLPTGLSNADTELSLKDLLSTINLELEKLQIGNDFLAIKNSQIGLKDAAKAFQGLFEEVSADKTEISKFSDYLKLIDVTGDLTNSPILERSYDKNFGSPSQIKNLPFESGKNGSLLLDLSALKAVSSENEELVLTSSIYLNEKSFTDKKIDNQPKETEAFNANIRISANGLSADISNLSYTNLTLSKEEFPLSSLSDISVITVDVPNKNLAALNVNISLENSENFVVPEIYAVLNFRGAQDSAQFSKQMIDLKSIESEHEQAGNKIFHIMSGIDVEPKDFEIDASQVTKSIIPNKGLNILTEKLTMFTSDLITSSEPSLINKFDLSEINSLEFAKILKERLQFATNSVTKKLNFKKDISEFLVNSKASLIIKEAVSKTVNKEMGLNDDKSIRKTLFLSTADVIGYRQALSNGAAKKDLLTKNSVDYFFTAGKENNDVALKATDEQLPAARSINVNSNMMSNFGSATQTHVEQNIARSGATLDSSSILQTQNFSQRISLLESQFSLRLSNALLEQAINSNESFDLILEPESFGKVRVNVSVDSSQIDVKLTAENSSTLAILRSSEGILQTISEQNGLKLAEYNVELNNNAQNNEGSQGRKNGKDQDANSNEGVEKLEKKLDPFDENDDSHSLNLIA
ncbi:MAG: hypothetical protein CML98_05630 [Rhodobiaceae bacterium]|nr:hypothetical protein [Rhodobiaceae bacterium]